jgi:hypothetical protein
MDIIQSINQNGFLLKYYKFITLQYNINNTII